MKETIESTFEHLTPEETAELLRICPDMTVDIDRSTQKRIRTRVQRQVRGKSAGCLLVRRPLYRRLGASAAALVVVAGVAGLVGLSDAAAEELQSAAAEGVQTITEAVKRLFTYVPGVGIIELGSSDATGDPADPDAPVDFTYLAFRTGTGSIPAADGSGETARLSRALYLDGKLVVNVECREREVAEDAFAISIDGTPIDPADEKLTFHADVYCSRTSHGDEWIDHVDTHATFSYEMDIPTEEKTIEITVEGYDGILSTTSVFYNSFEEISALGPTVEKNGIALTVNTEWKSDGLGVWITPYITDPENTDTLLHYGRLGNGSNFYHYSDAANQYNVHKASYERQTGIPYESGLSFVIDNLYERMMECIPNIHISSNQDPYDMGRPWQYTPTTMNTVPGYDVYDLPTTITEATLTIPFLAMRRDETHTLEIALPTEYGTTETDYVFATSLGNIRITSITRTRGDADTDGYDEIELTLAFDGCSEKEYLYDFQYTLECDRIGYTTASGDPGTARKDDIGLWVAPDEDTLTFSISALDYFLMDEYTFELDLTQPD